jgi:hypothetical protein
LAIVVNFPPLLVERCMLNDAATGPELAGDQESWAPQSPLLAAKPVGVLGLSGWFDAL